MAGYVLADSSALYALVDPRDDRHDKAHEDLDRLQDTGHSLSLPHPVLYESHALILHRLGISSAWRWLEEVTAGTRLIMPMATDLEGARLRLKRFSDQEISLADAVTAEIAITLEIPVWTYDHHFDLLGAPVWR